MTEESNPKSQARHVRIDSLSEHWQSDISCAGWQKQYHRNHEHCRWQSRWWQLRYTITVFPSHYKA